MSTKEKVIVVLIAFVAYAAIAQCWFRFAHPCLTETQLLTHTLDALRWHRVSGICQ